MKEVGVVEGFFGPAWEEPDRLSYAEFLSRYGGNFYLYAPKQDQYLRKGWRGDWPEEYLGRLKQLKTSFQAKQIKVGIGLSPFGLGVVLKEEDRKKLEAKARVLNDLGFDLLGLFFDDMPTNDGLAETQLEALTAIQAGFKKKIIFCPTYYTPDPILEKVFGKKPKDYLEKIAEGVPPEVSIAWTGPKVISTEIPEAHVLETKILLKRQPYIWENVFANDGPRNCKFLKLRAFSGREEGAIRESEAFAFNLMNQPQLSKIVFLGSKYVLTGENGPAEALDQAMRELCSPGLMVFLQRYGGEFLTVGLDNIPQEKKEALLKELDELEDPAAREIEDWLLGKYNVGSECLTD